MVVSVCVILNSNAVSWSLLAAAEPATVPPACLPSTSPLTPDSDGVGCLSSPHPLSPGSRRPSTMPPRWDRSRELRVDRSEDRGEAVDGTAATAGTAVPPPWLLSDEPPADSPAMRRSCSWDAAASSVVLLTTSTIKRWNLSPCASRAPSRKARLSGRAARSRLSDWASRATSRRARLSVRAASGPRPRRSACSVLGLLSPAAPTTEPPGRGTGATGSIENEGEGDAPLG